MCKKEIMGLTLEELQEELGGLGMKKFRAEQVFRWLYEKAATDFAQMSNLSKEARQQLAITVWKCLRCRSIITVSIPLVSSLLPTGRCMRRMRRR